jgi:hypothetical protein
MITVGPRKENKKIEKVKTPPIKKSAASRMTYTDKTPKTNWGK